MYGVHIKWQYTWFVIYSCFFLNSPSELTFWITLVYIKKYEICLNTNTRYEVITEVTEDNHLMGGEAK